MEVLSCGTGGRWLAQAAPAAARDDNEPRVDPAEQEARRILSDIFRCNNLVVLAGLGTSLCVLDPQTRTPLAPTMAALWCRVREKHTGDRAELWEQLLNIVRQPAGDENLESLLSRCRVAEQFLTGHELAKVQAFIALAEREIVAAVDFVTEGHVLTEHGEFLRRAARRSNRKLRTKIFTTNYDRCFEEAARQGRFVVVDGFSYTAPPTFDSVYFTYDIVRRDRGSETQDFIPNVFQLFKLHGSIDWERSARINEILKVRSPKTPLLIYPRSTKYELAFSQPYLEMMSALQAALREPNTGLLVIGFGFNDAHLAEPILSAVRSNLGLKVAIVSPGLAPRQNSEGEIPGEAQRNDYLRRIGDLIRAGDARLSLVNATFQEAIPYVPDIASETDLEKHLDRVRKLERQ